MLMKVRLVHFDRLCSSNWSQPLKKKLLNDCVWRFRQWMDLLIGKKLALVLHSDPSSERGKQAVLFFSLGAFLTSALVFNMPLMLSDATTRTRHIFNQPPPAPACRSPTPWRSHWLDFASIKGVNVENSDNSSSPFCRPMHLQTPDLTTIKLIGLSVVFCAMRLQEPWGPQAVSWHDGPSLTGDATFFITPLSPSVKGGSDKKKKNVPKGDTRPD